MKEANVDISNGIDLTNNATQRQALYNAVLKESQKFSGDAAIYSKTFAGALDQTKQSVTEFQSELGNMLKGPAGEFLKIFSSGIKEITVLLKVINEPKKIEEDIKKGGESALEGYSKKIEATNKKIKEMQDTLAIALANPALHKERALCPKHYKQR